MPDFDLDHLLARAVHDYHVRTMPHIKPAGSAAARATATRRRRTQAAAISAAVLLVLALPVAIYAILGQHHNGSPVITPSHTVTGTPVLSPSASVPTPDRPPITEDELGNATVDLPTWDQVDAACPSGTVTFHNGQVAASGNASRVELEKTAQVDLDGDGSQDVVAIFVCEVGNPGWETAIAFRRVGNAIQTMGAVAPGIHQFKDVRAGADGTVDLQVSDDVGSGGISTLTRVVQWRTYRWTSSGFSQSGGSTSFTVEAPLSATVSDLVFGPAVNGTRTGHLTISLRNNGSQAISNIWMLWSLYPGTLTGQTCSAAQTEPGRCDISSLAPGATFEATLTYTASDSDVEPYLNDNQPIGLSQIAPSVVQIRIGDQRLATQPTLGNLVIQ